MSGCIIVDLDANASVFREELRRARKEYACVECGETIQRGDLHEYATGMWDGRWDAFRTCARCTNVRNDYFWSWEYGFMVEAFYEEHGVDYRDGIPEHIQPCRGATR